MVLMNEIQWNADGLIPAIVQDSDSKEILMLAYMNQAALEKTLEIKEAVFWSRSRQEIWHKGLSSGNRMHVQEIKVDCDADTLLLLVKPDGPACHTGAISCFYRSME
ncbi:hypothetical protein MASR2M15_14430 [Anaerolineales bacterium]